MSLIYETYDGRFQPQFFSREVIKQKDDISDGIGYPDWQLCLWLLLAWIVIYLVIVKGVKSSGKVSYFTAIFPYVVILILLIRGATLEGAWNGIKFFITPDFKRLLEPQVNLLKSKSLNNRTESLGTLVCLGRSLISKFRSFTLCHNQLSLTRSQHCVNVLKHFFFISKHFCPQRYGTER